VAVAARLRLLDEVQARGVRPGGFAVGVLGTGGDDDAHFVPPASDTSSTMIWSAFFSTPSRSTSVCSGSAR